MKRLFVYLFWGGLFAIWLSILLVDKPGGGVELLNLSYDPTREFYKAYNQAFAKHWEEIHGEQVTLRQSHGGSSRQARSVIDGINADVITLALAADIDAIADHGLVAEDWQQRLPANSAPYQSTLAFLVRKGNPKNIQDWSDLIREDIEVITPNPMTSGVARWNYLAAWGWALQEYKGDESKVLEYMNRLYQNVPVLDTGARGASATFLEREIGDVLINWENELLMAIELRGEEFEMIVPSISILAEPTVAVVDRNVQRRGTEELASAYLEYLYSDEAQHLASEYYYRPSNPEILKQYTDRFPPVKLFTIDEVFGGWKKVTDRHFSRGGVFEQIYLGNEQGKG